MQAPQTRRIFTAAAIALAALTVGAGSAAAVPKGSTVLVDRPTGFGPLPYDRTSHSSVRSHALTADGCTVVYSSASDDLLATDEDAAYNVLAQDRCTPGATPVQVNVSAAGEPAAAFSESYDATISANGRWVAFVSDAENLHPDARGADHYVFVKDLQTGELDLASRGNGETGAPAGEPEDAVISGDGRSVAFIAEGPVDALGDQDGVADQQDAYLRSLVFDITRMVSLTAGGVRGGGVEDDYGALDIDHTGSNVAFISDSGLVPTDTDDDEDAYLRLGIGTIGQTTALVSFTAGNTTGATSANEVAISADGTRVAYANGSLWLSACTPCKPADRIDKARPGGSNSGDDHERPFFAQTAGAAPSAVFWSTANALDPADLNGKSDVYGALLAGGADPVRGLTAGVADGEVRVASANDNLDLAVFATDEATNLAGADGVHWQVFERAGGTVRNLAALAGVRPRAVGTGHADFHHLHALSGDGRLAVFGSQAPALGAPYVGGRRLRAVLARELTTGRTIPVSVAPDGSPANQSAYGPGVDAAGRRVVFTSTATNLGTAVSGSAPHVYVRDLQTGTTRLVDRNAAGTPATLGAQYAQISGDGTKVAFVSSSPDLPGAGGNVAHVYRVDLRTGQTVLVDRSGNGTPSDRSASSPDISFDGSRVAFASDATNLGGPANAYSEVYVRDLAAGTTTWASAPQATPATRPVVGLPSLSGDGNRVAFQVVGAGFGYGAADDARVFVRDLAARRTTLASPGAPQRAEDGAPTLSRDGTKVAFGRYTGSTAMTLVRDLSIGALTRADRRNGSTAPGRLGGYGAGLSANGACVLFASNSDDLVSPSPGPDFTHLYLHALGGDCPAVDRTAGGGSGQAADTQAPVISGARVTNRRFAPARSKTARRARRGTTFVFRVSEPARTTIAIARRAAGRRSGKRCVKPRKGLRRRCVRHVPVTSLTRARTVQGSNRVAFSGRIGRRALARGRYRAAIVATDAAGNRSRPAFVRFRVVR